jgi:ubiquinone/menaquinone biosynthesis C-methylase UbiE
MNLEAYSSKEAVKVYEKSAGLTPDESKVIEKIFTKRGATILDVGVGGGRTTKYFYDNGFNVIGIDYSEPLIRMAKERYPEINFEVMDATKLSFRDESFDYVFFSYQGIDYVEPNEKRLNAILEAKRVLKRNGVFVYSSHNSYYLFNRVALLTCLRNLLNKSKYRKRIARFGLVEEYYNSRYNELKILNKIGFSKIVTLGGRSDWLKPFIHYICFK